MSADFSEVQKLATDLAKAPVRMAARTLAENRTAGMRMQASARSRVRVETGRLRDSITYQMTPTGVILGSDVDYAPFQEYGTAFIPPNPAINDALDSEVDPYAARMGQVLGETLL